MALTLVALALRSVGLGRFELWVDEAATWWFARLVWGGGLALESAQESTPPLYYAIVGLAMRLFGDSDAVLRLPSALAGTATVPLLFAFARRLGGERVGWFAAILLTVHPLHIFYSREARPYPLLLFCTVLLFHTLWNALEDDTRRDWAWFSAALFGVCCLHFMGFFLGFVVGVQILIFGRGFRGRVRGLTAAAVAGLLLLPYVLWTLPDVGGNRALWSTERLYEMIPEDVRFGRVLEMQMVGADYHPMMRGMDRPPTPPLLRLLALTAQFTLIITGLLWAFRNGLQRGWGFLFVGWMLSILGPWGISQVWKPIHHPGRHDFYATGVVMVLLALGLEALLSWKRRGLGRSVFTMSVLALALGAFFRLVSLAQLPPGDQSRAKGRWLAEHADSDHDRVVATGILRAITERYTRLAGGDVPFQTFPSSVDEHPGWSDDRALIEDPEALAQDARETVAGLAGSEHVYLLLRPYQRDGDRFSATWLVDRHVMAALRSAGWEPREDERARELGIEIYEPSSTPGDPP